MTLQPHTTIQLTTYNDDHQTHNEIETSINYRSRKSPSHTRFKCFNFMVTLLSLILSATVALCYTQQWFTPFIRGIFVLSVASTNVIIRAMQCIHGFRHQNKIWNAATDTKDLQNGNKIGDMAIIHIYILLSTCGDCLFDLIQGYILLNDIPYESDVNLYVIIGTWFGAAEELIDLIEDGWYLCLDECCETLLERSSIKAFCTILMIMIIIEQLIGIYIVVRGIKSNIKLLMIIISLNGTVILIALILLLLLYCCYDSIKKYISSKVSTNLVVASDMVHEYDEQKEFSNVFMQKNSTLKTSKKLSVKHEIKMERGSKIIMSNFVHESILNILHFFTGNIKITPDHFLLCQEHPSSVNSYRKRTKYWYIEIYPVPNPLLNHTTKSGSTSKHCTFLPGEYLIPHSLTFDNHWLNLDTNYCQENDVDPVLFLQIEGDLIMKGAIIELDAVSEYERYQDDYIAEFSDKQRDGAAGGTYATVGGKTSREQDPRGNEQLSEYENRTRDSGIENLLGHKGSAYYEKTGADYRQEGGLAGGALLLKVNGKFIMKENSSIYCRGQESMISEIAGQGSGGSIKIICDEFIMDDNCRIWATGKKIEENWLGGVGGDGRIAIYCKGDVNIEGRNIDPKPFFKLMQ